MRSSSVLNEGLVCEGDNSEYKLANHGTNHPPKMLR
jgi:hypothetical protein